MAITTSLKLPEDLKERIAALVEGVAQTPHAYMVDAIAERVARDEKRREFMESARQSVADVTRTGVVHSHAEVKRYVLAKAAGRKPARPKGTRIPRSGR